MGTLYDWLKLAHVLAAMIWLGGLVTLVVLGVRARRSDDRDSVARFVGSLRVVGPAVLAPSAALAVALGIGLVLDSGAWDFGQAWVQVALGLVAAAILVGAVFLARTALAAERFVAAADHRAATRQLGRWSWGIAVVIVLLVVATWDMVVKPGL
jgi:uncharacterized membrane protein